MKICQTAASQLNQAKNKENDFRFGPQHFKTTAPGKARLIQNWTTFIQLSPHMQTQHVSDPFAEKIHLQEKVSKKVMSNYGYLPRVHTQGSIHSKKAIVQLWLILKMYGPNEGVLG